MRPDTLPAPAFGAEIHSVSNTVPRPTITILGEKVADAGCTYRAIRRSCLADMPVFNGMHRFLPTILRLQGYTVTEAAVNDRPRVAGVSKYGVNNRLWRGLRDCLAMRWFAKRAIPGRRQEPEPAGAAERSPRERETIAT